MTDSTDKTKTTAEIEALAGQYDVYREDGESDAELADRTMAVLDEMMNELIDAQDELRVLCAECA